MKSEITNHESQCPVGADLQVAHEEHECEEEHPEQRSGRTGLPGGPGVDGAAFACERPSLVCDVRPDADEDPDGTAHWYIPGSNHAQFIFDVLGPDGKPTIGKDGKPARWGVETGSAAAMARRGISPKTFPNGTVFTVTFFPLRDGRPFGAMTGEFIKCGAEMPAGGCTKATGEVLVIENN